MNPAPCVFLVTHQSEKRAETVALNSRVLSFVFILAHHDILEMKQPKNCWAKAWARQRRVSGVWSMIIALWSRFVLSDTERTSKWDRIHRNFNVFTEPSHTNSSIPENAHRSISRHVHVGFVHKHSLEAGVRVTAGQDLLVKLKDLMQERHWVFEQRQQLRQAEMCHLCRNDRSEAIITVSVTGCVELAIIWTSFTNFTTVKCSSCGWCKWK